MDKNALLEKIGTLLENLQQSYKHISESTDSINPLEIELFEVNSIYFSEHTKILTKMQQEEERSAMEMEDTAEEQETAEAREERKETHDGVKETVFTPKTESVEEETIDQDEDAEQLEVEQAEIEPEETEVEEETEIEEDTEVKAETEAVEEEDSIENDLEEEEDVAEESKQEDTIEHTSEKDEDSEEVQSINELDDANADEEENEEIAPVTDESDAADYEENTPESSQRVEETEETEYPMEEAEHKVEEAPFRFDFTPEPPSLEGAEPVDQDSAPEENTIDFNTPEAQSQEVRIASKEVSYTTPSETASEPEQEDAGNEETTDAPESKAAMGATPISRLHEQVAKERPLSLNERLSAQRKAQGMPDGSAPVKPELKRIKDIKSAVSLNDKLLFIKDLFNGYSLAYSEAMELLNRCGNLQEADQFLQNNYAAKNNWGTKQETVNKLYDVLKKRFA